MKSFGVGCLHFSIGDKAKDFITVKDYIDEVKRTLEQFNTVTNISISFDEGLKDEEIDTSVVSTYMHEGGHCNPCIQFFELEFKVYIPYRVQASLIHQEERYLDTRTENFKVYFRHDWHGPAAFIECIDADDECQPSTAVRVVREYLEKEIEGVDSFLVADYLGPSPFHADFYLSGENGEEGEGFSVAHEKKPGYDRLIFTYNREEFGSEKEALNELFEKLSQELGFYYGLKTISVQNIKSWYEINETMNKILEFERENSNKTLSNKIFDRPKLFRKIFQEIGLFKGRQIIVNSINDQRYSNIYKSEKHKTYLKDLIDKEISSEQMYPLSETSELMSYFDQKTTKSLELSIVFIAAVMGGIVGAIITVLFGSSH